MHFSRLVFLSLWRHRIRAAIGSAGIAFGVAAMLSVLSVVLGAIGMFEKILSTDSQYLVFEKNVSDLFFSSVRREDIDQIRSMDAVEQANPLLFGIVSSPGHPVITCFGIESDDPRFEKAEWLSGSLAEWKDKPRTVLLGHRAADFLKIGFGERVEIGAENFEVAGIISTENGFEDGGVFMPLMLAQEYFHREDISSVVAVKLKDTADGETFMREVETLCPGLIALENEAFQDSYSQFRILKATSWAVGLCAFLLGGMGVANTMLLSVFSRIREIAVLQVCGFSKLQVGSLILMEAAFLALLGSLFGFLAGFGLLEILKSVPQLQGYVQTVMNPLVWAAIFVTAEVTSILGSLYPAWFAMRIQPAEALRYE
jgi:putative ABC transport system permease protein